MKIKFVKTEADVAGEFYHQAKLRGWTPEMEVKLSSRHHRSGYMRADCVLYVDGERICAVEFKRHGHKEPSKESRQGKAYSELKIPFVFCIGRDGVKEAIDKIEDLVHESLAV